MVGSLSASRRGFSRVGLRFFVRIDVLWARNDVEPAGDPATFPLYLMDLLVVIEVVHESAMNITEVEAVLGFDPLGPLASVDDSRPRRVESGGIREATRGVPRPLFSIRSASRPPRDIRYHDTTVSRSRSTRGWSTSTIAGRFTMTDVDKT